MCIIMVRRKNALRNRITEKTEFFYFFLLSSEILALKYDQRLPSSGKVMVGFAAMHSSDLTVCLPEILKKSPKMGIFKNFDDGRLFYT